MNPDLIDLYRTVMTRAAAGDWEGYRARGEAAERLATRAYVDGERAAWEVSQVAQWRLQRKSSLRPTEPGDVLVLDTFYRVEESTIRYPELPRGLTPREVCARIAKDISVFSSEDSPTIRGMSDGSFTREDWSYLAWQWLPPTDDFTRMIAIASLPLPHAFSMTMYANLWDEAGRGVLERSHRILLHRFLAYFDVDTTDPEKILDWALPDMIAVVNEQYRMLWHPEPAWTLGSMYLYEKLLPGELGRIRAGLAKIGVPDHELAWFDEHIVVDVQHAEDWLAVIEQFLLRHEDQSIAYAAAMDRGRYVRRAWDSMHPGLRRFKETGIADRLPARELREATGL